MPSILVYDVAAGETGALAVLMDFHRQVLASQDKTTRWVFVVGSVPLSESGNVTVLHFPWVKKSWAHRLFFDIVMMKRLVKRYGIDRIYSMQNLTVPRVSQEQIVYLHNCLPFITHRFTLTEPRLWLYQNILGPMMKRSIRKARRVIVQTQWMRQACVRYADPARVAVVPPKINRGYVIPYRDTPESRRIFFYPAAPLPYKNHIAIIDACRQMQADDYCVIFTFTGNESRYARRLYRLVREKGLNIQFNGTLPRKKVFELYANSVLLYPSLAETFGMPLMEARLAGSFICASALPYSKEVLAGYENALFFDPNDHRGLKDIMLGISRREYFKYDDAVPAGEVSLIGAVTVK